MDTRFLVTILLVSLGVGILSYCLSRQPDLQKDSYQPATMGLVAAMYLLVFGIVASLFGWGWWIVAFVGLGLWVFAPKHNYTATAVVNWIALTWASFYMLLVKGNHIFSTPTKVMFGVSIACALAIVIDYVRYNGEREDEEKQQSTESVARTIFFVVATIAVIIWIISMLAKLAPQA